MKVTFYGTRGSVPISNPRAVKYGGNTTSLRIDSPCLPANHVLATDAGSGFLPLSVEAIAQGTQVVHLLFTHWHHDHTQGLPLSPLTFKKDIPVMCWGPVESGYGPREVLEQIMKPPFFPLDFLRVGSHFTTRKIKNPDASIIVCHSKGGLTMVTQEDFERSNGMVSFGQKGKYPKSECLLIRMLYTNHPERTITYRFEEGSTGMKFVFLTDHENQQALSLDLRRHLDGADLLVMDSQYTRAKYEKFTAGFGHGTPDYCVKTALQVGAKRLGLTHHDPTSIDADVDAIVEEALQAYDQLSLTDEFKGQPLALKRENIFACKDYQSVELYNPQFAAEVA